MKKTITFAAVLAFAMGAYAQQEAAFVNVEALGIGGDYGDNIPEGTELCKSENITMTLPWGEPYKTSELVADADAVNEIVIDGQTYGNLATGIQGKNNPKPNDLKNAGQQEGAVLKFVVEADGYLYVIGKYSNNKNYYVWEGPVSEKKGRPMAYTMSGAVVSTGTGVRYTLPADKDGYYVSYRGQWDPGYDNGSSYKQAQECVATYMGDSLMTGGTLGVIAFPVYKDADYYVNACGSKITANGFVFIPGATTLAPISLSKDGTVVAGVEKVTVDAVVDENAPVYNINGQQVSKDTKGLLIQKGKKYYNQ